jgi:hypothetical protein
MDCEAPHAAARNSIKSIGHDWEVGGFGLGDYEIEGNFSQNPWP